MRQEEAVLSASKARTTTLVDYGAVGAGANSAINDLTAYAIDWVADAFRQVKAIAVSAAATTLLKLAKVPDEGAGILVLASPDNAGGFLSASRAQHGHRGCDEG